MPPFPGLNWDAQLYQGKFTGLAKTTCHACGSTDHFANMCPIAPNRSTRTRPREDLQLCQNYNKKFQCASNPCPFKHRCNRPGCVCHHPGAEHDKRADKNINHNLHHLKPKTPVNIVYLQHELKNHPDVLFLSNLVQGFCDGFSIGFEGPCMPHFSHDLKSAVEHPDLVTKNLLNCLLTGPIRVVDSSYFNIFGSVHAMKTENTTI